MSTKALPPKIGFAMNVDVVTEWLVADGSQGGHSLYALDSDKSVQGNQSPASGLIDLGGTSIKSWEKSNRRRDHSRQ
jgi:hypothetical protein